MAQLSQLREEVAQYAALNCELLESLEETLRQLKTITHNWIEDDLNNLIKERAEAVIRKAKGV